MQTTNPLVSVVIPCYNAEPFIRKCIQSVLDQDYKPLQIVLVNDGSTDNSAEVAREYQAVQILEQANSGGCVARNLGLKYANGKYIKFLDADDFLDSNCISSQVTQAEFLGDKYIVYGNFSILRGNRASLVNTNIGFDNQLAKLLFSDLLTSTPLHHSYMLKSIGGFDERFKSGQEWNLHVRLAAKGYFFYHMNKNIYFYRIHQSENRISNKRNLNTSAVFEHEINKVSMTLDAIRSSTPVDFSSFVAMKYWWLGRQAIRKGLLETSEICFELAKSSAVNYKKNWPLYYRVFYELLGVHMAETLFKPVYKIFGGRYTKY